MKSSVEQKSSDAMQNTQKCELQKRLVLFCGVTSFLLSQNTFLVKIKMLFEPKTKAEILTKKKKNSSNLSLIFTGSAKNKRKKLFFFAKEWQNITHIVIFNQYRIIELNQKFSEHNFIEKKKKKKRNIFSSKRKTKKKVLTYS